MMKQKGGKFEWLFSAEHEKNGQSSQQTQRNWMKKN